MDFIGQKSRCNHRSKKSRGKKGCYIAYNCAVECAKNGEVVISGMALGCDTAAHQGCLSVNGKTIAIVASGLDITHPKENKPLTR